ncbi:putative membrane protein [Murinocardiopsis flavida]|uniref:Putative membrane protein n=1 Tax=Murinocardiopsis flavida TaxID=645275 RepID=A0A2P8D8V9_9ACTN|nr:EamA family transporter [Murinocardiopsis flavida]PSK93643.1 putative membrane protein [Murinocardiopsis flavida]
MGEALALVSALCFGLTDVAAGLLSRRAHSITVACYGQAFGTVLMAAVVPFAAAPEVHPADLGWGALSGVGTGLGAAALFHAMSVGRFSTVVPLSVVAGAALPVLAGVALLDERPGVAAWAGIAASVPALWLIARSTGGRGGPGDGGAVAGLLPALLAGAAFALQYTALAQADPAAGLWPLLANRAASAVLVFALVLPRPARLRVPALIGAGAAGSGALSTAAITAFALAGRAQDLSTAAVLTSMYPVVPVLWGVAALGERLDRHQSFGLVCAAAAIGLIAAG